MNGVKVSDFMEEVERLKEEVNLIKERNRKVEMDKKWEQSFTRRALLVLFTYLAIGVYLQAINIPLAWLNAIVPAVAFLLSTLTMSYFKKIWISFGAVQDKKILVNKKQAEEKKVNKQKILEGIDMQKSINNDSVQNLLGVSDTTATRYLDELEKEGKIKQIGDTGRGVFYERI